MEYIRPAYSGCEQALASYRTRRLETGSPEAHLLKFPRIEDVYNITHPFDGVIAGRVEQRTSEFSKVMFFKEGSLDQEFDAPVFNLQDPFVQEIEGELVFGGVHLMNQDKQQSTFRTEFYKGPDIYHLTPLAQGPLGEKDIRFVQREGRVGVMRRPQGGKYGPGKLAYQELPTTEGLQALFDLPEIPDRHVLPDNFEGSEWGGANQLFDLDDSVGVLGHIARKDGIGNRHYYPMAFVLDPTTRMATEMEILAEARDFPEWKPAKKPDLDDVVFTGGLDRHGDGTADLYVGLKDTYAAMARIQDPFS